MMMMTYLMTTSISFLNTFSQSESNVRDAMSFSHSTPPDVMSRLQPPHKPCNKCRNPRWIPEKQLQRMCTNQPHPPLSMKPKAEFFVFPNQKLSTNKLSTGFFTTGYQTQLALKPTKISSTHKSLYRWVTAIDRNEECEQSIGGAHGRLKLRNPLNASLTVFPPKQKPQRSLGSQSPITKNAFLVSEFPIRHRNPHRTVVIQSHELAGTCWERVPMCSSAPQRSLSVRSHTGARPLCPHRTGRISCLGNLLGAWLERVICGDGRDAGISTSDGEDSARGIPGM